MKRTHQQPKYAVGSSPSLGHDYHSPSGVWASTPRQQGYAVHSTSWVDQGRQPYDYATYGTADMGRDRDPYYAAPPRSAFYDRPTASPPSPFYDPLPPRYSTDYRIDPMPLSASNGHPPAAIYGQTSRQMFEPPRQFGANSFFANASNARSGLPPTKPYNTSGPRSRGVTKKRNFGNQGFTNTKRVAGELKRALTNENDTKKKTGGQAGKAVTPKEKPSPQVSKEKTTTIPPSAAQNQEKKERSIPKSVMEDLEGFIEKSKSMGETRRRQVRYKMFRLFGTQDLDYVTITEQVGTFAKRGQLRMKVTLKTFFPQVFTGECNGVEYEDTSYECTVRLMLKLHKLGILPIECIANFYEKKPHYSHQLFLRAKTIFKLLVEETDKQEFTANFKEGKTESTEQTTMLQACIEKVAERVRKNDLPVEIGVGAQAQADEEDNDEADETSDSKAAVAKMVAKMKVEGEETPIYGSGDAVSAPETDTPFMEVSQASEVATPNDANGTADIVADVVTVDTNATKEAEVGDTDASGNTMAELDCTDEA